MNKIETIKSELHSVNEGIANFKRWLLEAELKKEGLELLLAKTEKDIEYTNAIRVNEDQRAGYDEE